jgi:hypothetical protein
MRRLRGWAKHGPDFVHMSELLQAEAAALGNRTRQALAQYELAARRAKQQGYVHHAALAHERSGELLLRLRRRSEATRAFARARELYEEWGALGKAERLRARERHPDALR